jgi:hypothetical protein
MRVLGLWPKLFMDIISYNKTALEFNLLVFLWNKCYYSHSSGSDLEVKITDPILQEFEPVFADFMKFNNTYYSLIRKFKITN